MLEGILVVRNVVIVVVRIGEEGVSVGKDIRCTQVGSRQLCPFRVPDGENLLGIAGQVLAQLVAQVGIRVAVADDLDGLRGADASVVGGDHHLAVILRQSSEQFREHRVAQPALRDAAVGTLRIGELAYHLRFRPGMREHVDEVDYQHVQVLLPAFVVVLHKPVGALRIVHLVIAEAVSLAVSVEHCLYQRLLVQVLALLLVFIHPELRKHLGNPVGHQTAEDGVPGVLRGGRQDAHIHIFVYVEQFADVSRQHLPLVVSEVVYHDEEHLLPLVQNREDPVSEDIRAHHRAVVGRRCIPILSGIPIPHQVYPFQIVPGDEFGESDVSLLLLHGEHLGHLAVGIAQFQFPFHESSVYLHPVAAGTAVHHLQCNLLVVLLVSALRHLGHDILLVDVLFQREQDLARVDGLDEIVGDFRPDSLVHDVFLFALGTHHNGSSGLDVLDLLQGLQAAQSRHHFIEEDEVEGLLSA